MSTTINTTYLTTVQNGRTAYPSLPTQFLQIADSNRNVLSPLRQLKRRARGRLRHDERLFGPTSICGLLWLNTTLQSVTNDCAERLPLALASERSVKSHLKAVDTATGEIVGYSRYIHPGRQTASGLMLRLWSPVWSRGKCLRRN